MRARSTRLLVPALLGAAVALLATDRSLADAQSLTPPDQRVFGTWHLNAAKSKFNPGPPYRSQTRIYEPHDSGVKATIKTTYSDGHSVDVEYTAEYDSLEYPVTGAPEYDSIKLHRVDSFTSEAVLGHAGKVFATARRIISEDGKTMTIIYQVDPSSRSPINNVMVYDKQQP
jgi:hypothetical protein